MSREISYGLPLASDLSRVVSDPIVSIEYIGKHPIYDIGVEGTHTIVASDVLALQCQDMNWDFIPVIEETASAVIDYGFIAYSGTPKTLDNTLTVLWTDSSMGEWVTKCEHCNHWNIPTLEHDILKMIGKKSCVCAKCGKTLNCAMGQVVHAAPEKRAEFSGYHIPQIVHPIHYLHENKWRDILHKMRVYPQSKFYNEVLGLECDSSQKLITRAQLMKAAARELPNTLKAAIDMRNTFRLIVMGIDWGGGGGEECHSYTSISIGGLRPGSEDIECIYGAKLSRYLQPAEETKIVKDLFIRFNPTFLAHDYGGAGALRETLLIQAGIPAERLVPYTYVMSPAQAVITYNEATIGYRSSYSMDKSRSLMILCEMIKARKVVFPTWDTIRTVELDGDQVTLLQDFEHLFQDRLERASGSDIVRIDKSPRKSDDFVHAVNYMASTIWYTRQAYPNLAEANQMRLTIEDIEAIAPDQSHLPIITR